MTTRFSKMAGGLLAAACATSAVGCAEQDVGSATQLTKTRAASVAATEDHAFFTTNEGLYRVSLAGGDATKVGDQKLAYAGGLRHVVIHGGLVYWLSTNVSVDARPVGDGDPCGAVLGNTRDRLGDLAPSSQGAVVAREHLASDAQGTLTWDVVSFGGDGGGGTSACATAESDRKVPAGEAIVDVAAKPDGGAIAATKTAIRAMDTGEVLVSGRTGIRRVLVVGDTLAWTETAGSNDLHLYAGTLAAPSATRELATLRCGGSGDAIATDGVRLYVSALTDDGNSEGCGDRPSIVSIGLEGGAPGIVLRQSGLYPGALAVAGAKIVFADQDGDGLWMTDK